jgi:hypothetical protein
MGVFRLVAAGLAGLAAGAGAAAANGLARSPEELVARMDHDGDARVDVREYQAYLSRAFQLMDRNSNDVVDLDELPAGVVDARTRPIPLAQHRDNLASAFRAQDRNGDGKLDALELAAPPP